MSLHLETPRLLLRPICPEDREALAGILGDPEVMYAWEHGFTPQEIDSWILTNQNRYQTDNCGYLTAVEKASGQVVGQIGPLLEPDPQTGKRLPGIGYILGKAHWGKGFAREGAAACLDYWFLDKKEAEAVTHIRPQNLSSRRVSQALGMEEAGEMIVHYRGKEMPHLIYRITREKWEKIRGELSIW